jgi:hypothetical protein
MKRRYALAAAAFWAVCGLPGVKAEVPVVSTLPPASIVLLRHALAPGGAIRQGSGWTTAAPSAI